MKRPLLRHIPPRAAIAVVALVLLAGIVTGGERSVAPAVVVAPADKPVPAIAPDELDLKKLPVRERRERSTQDLFAGPAPVAMAAIPAPAQAPKAAPPAEPPPAPAAPPLPFSYLGQMKTGERTILYLLKGGELHLAEAGQPLDTHYRIESISEAAVHFVYLPLGTRQALNVPPPQ